MSLRPGEEVGRFRVIESLGSGGMGQVYRAYDPSLGGEVALKVLPRQGFDETSLKRFEREAVTLAKLEHPHIVAVYDAGTRDELPWISMRLLPGGTLSSGRLALQAAVRVLGEVGSALDHAHSMGVLHRDVKPANVLLDEEGRAYLSDFGISKAVEGSISLTRTGGLVGTPAYMAPEQARGEEVDERVDVYALGVVAFQMFTGRLPFSGSTLWELLRKKTTKAAPVLAPDEVPKPVSKAIARALARKPEARWNTPGEFVGAIVAGLGGGVPEAPEPGPMVGDPTRTLLPVTATHTKSETARSGSTWKSERADDYRRLWAALAAWMTARGAGVQVGTGALNWVRADVGVGGFRPTVSHSFDSLTLAVNLMFGPDREAERFAAALAAKDQLERALGGPLEWAAPDAKKPWATALLDLSGKTLDGEGFPWVLDRLRVTRELMPSIFAARGL